MLTAKDTLKWVTRRPVPPWGIEELRPALKANPARDFSLKQAITLVEKEICVISVGVRDFAVVKSAATWAELKANWNSSAPSKNTLTSVITKLGAQGAFLKNLSKDWKTAAIVSPLPSLKNIGGVVITESDYNAPSTGSVIGAIGKIVGSETAQFIGAVLVLMDAFVDDSAMTFVPSGGFGSSAGGDLQSTGSGEDTLFVPAVTIEGTFTGVDPSTLPDAPPVQVGDLPPGPSDGSDGTDGGGDTGGP